MNKLGLVLGVAAVAAIAGCKDPNYNKHGTKVQNTAQPVPTQTVEDPTPVVVEPEKPVETEIVSEEVHCTCPPGTIHKQKCACGAPDCACAVEVPAPVVVPPTPVVEETTPYIVQRGDYLAKISKKYNITLNAIRRVNPNLKGDVIRVGQTIQLPGKVNVGEQTKPVVAPVNKPKVVKEYKPYVGPTKDYTIKNGDSLGVIAKRNGISVRQLKELNGLSSDVIRVGKTLKGPAEKVAAPAPAVAVAAAPKKEAPKAAAKPVAAKPVVAAPVVEATPAVVEQATETKAEDAAPTVVPETSKAGEDGALTHVVAEGEDITSLSILYSLSPTEIRSYNNLADDEELKPGQALKIPVEQQ